MDQLICEQILWAETGDLTANDDDTRGMLRVLRGHIAALAVQTDGKPFPTRTALDRTMVEQPRDNGTNAAAECRELAAQALASTLETVPAAILICDDQSMATPTTVLPWDISDPTVVRLGPFYFKEKQLRAFIRPDGPGVPPLRFWSSLTRAGINDASSAKISIQRPLLPASAKRWGYATLAVAIVGFVLACGMAETAGSLTRATYLAASGSLPEKCKINPSSPGDLTSTAAAWQPSFQLVTPAPETPATSPRPDDCRAAWTKAQMLVTSRETPFDSSLPFWRWLTSKWCVSQGAFSIKIPMVMMMLSLLCLTVSSGFGVLGLPLGILIDNRYRMSLTRTQFAAWTIVLIGGWATLALFNLGFSAVDVRELGQLAANDAKAVTDPAMAGPSAAALAAFNFFPAMDWPLWAVLGISLGTTSISALLLDRNLPSATTASSDQPPFVLTKASAVDADLSDLVYGETQDSKNVVDATRVQHVGITAVLVASYTVLLWQFGVAIGGLEAMRSITNHTALFANMPPISPSFLAMLVVTHGALLAGKFYDNKKTPVAT